MRYNARVDANQKEIVAHLRKRGASVQHVHGIPGALDIWVGYASIDVRCEIKDGSKPPSQQKLTKSEQEVFDNWEGREPVILRSIEDADNLLDSLRWAANLDINNTYIA